MKRYFVYHNLVYTFHILILFNTHIHTQHALTQTLLSQYFFLFISINILTFDSCHLFESLVEMSALDFTHRNMSLNCQVSIKNQSVLLHCYEWTLEN